MLTDILNEFVGGKNKVWAHDRMLTVGASEIGACARRTYYFKNAALKDKDYVARWGATQRGDLIEQHLVVPALRKRFGDKLLWAGEEQQTFQKGHLSATPDGLLTGIKPNALRHLGVKDRLLGTCLLVEIKSIDPRARLAEERHHHKLQAIAQLGLVRLLTEYKPNYVLLIYIDASFHDEIKEFVVQFDQTIFDNLQKRATKILTAKAASELPAEGWIAGGGECETCPFKDPCGIERHALPSEKFKSKPVSPQRVAEMTDLCRQAKELAEVRDKYDADYRTQQEAIKERLREWDIRKVPGVVTLSAVKGRVGYNTDELKAAAEAAGIDTEKFMRIGEPTTRLTISLDE
jgi:CRISPR/Cas system-associated exonuclease Cas4 (RecB family)